MRLSARRLGLLALCLALLPPLASRKARGSDHADTPAIASLPGADLTDVFLFPSPTDSSKVVLAMTVHPLIPTGIGSQVAFDPNVLYQFKIDNTGDNVEDLVIQAKFVGSNPVTQQVQISGPVLPSHIGTVAVQEPHDSVIGTLNVPFTTSNGIKVFAGPREDPFFFDLNQFYSILPDRASPVYTPSFTNTAGQQVSTSPSNPNAPQMAAWRPAGQAQDFLKGLNVLAIVVEMPKTMLTGGGSGRIGVWCTTSK